MNFTLSRIIDIVHGHSYDAEKIVLHLMKTNPELFLALYDDLTIPKSIGTEKHMSDNGLRLVSFLKLDQKVNAIKFVRAQYYLSLRESKDIVDKFQNFAIRTGLIDNKEYCDSVILNYNCNIIFNNLTGE